MIFFFFSSRRRHTRWTGDWSSDVCSSDLRELVSFCQDESPIYYIEGGAAPSGTTSSVFEIPIGKNSQALTVPEIGSGLIGAIADQNEISGRCRADDRHGRCIIVCDVNSAAIGTEGLLGDHVFSYAIGEAGAVTIQHLIFEQVQLAERNGAQARAGGVPACFRRVPSGRVTS